MVIAVACWQSALGEETRVALGERLWGTRRYVDQQTAFPLRALAKF